MTAAAPSLNETAALERHRNGSVVDLANAGAGIGAAADTSITVAWAQKYAVVYQVVEQIVDTPIFPSGFWPLPLGVKPWEFRTPWLKHEREDWETYNQRRRIAAAGGTAAALWGEGYGWTPPQSWRLLYPANGKVSLYAEGVLALLRGAGFGVEKVERSETRAALRIRRPGAEWQEYEFTWADAVRAGYVPGEGPNKGKDKGGNEKYHTDPKTMLWARAVTTGGRIEAPDVLAGMPVAELVDDDLEPARDVTVTASTRPADAAGSGSSVLASALEQSMLRREAAASVALDRDQTHMVEEASPPIEQTDWRRLMARFNELGVNGLGRDVRRLKVMSHIVGREIAKGSELSKDEAQLILDNLAGAAGPRLVAEVEDTVDPAVVDQEDDEPRAATQDDVEAEANELNPDVPEPTPDEGRPAALEGGPDPWGDPT